MTRITSVGLSKKKFVSSTAEEAADSHMNEAGPSTATTGPSTGDGNGVQPKKKSKRRGTRGKDPADLAKKASFANGHAQRGWSRDGEIAYRERLKAQRAAHRLKKREDLRHMETTCFACRGVGHAARDCPNILLEAQMPEGTADMLGGKSSGTQSATEPSLKGMKRKKGTRGAELVGGRCYRCNSTQHSLGQCPEMVDPENPTPYATCYICLGTGHLSSLCPTNKKGIYVNGGSCKVCGSTAHRAKDCPVEKERFEAVKLKAPSDEDGSRIKRKAGADEDDFMVDSWTDRVQKAQNQEKAKKSRKTERGIGNAVEVPMTGRNEEGADPVGVAEDHALHSVPPRSEVRAKPRIVKF